MHWLVGPLGPCGQHRILWGSVNFRTNAFGQPVVLRRSSLRIPVGWILYEISSELLTSTLLHPSSCKSNPYHLSKQELKRQCCPKLNQFWKQGSSYSLREGKYELISRTQPIFCLLQEFAGLILCLGTCQIMKNRNKVVDIHMEFWCHKHWTMVWVDFQALSQQGFNKNQELQLRALGLDQDHAEFRE